MLLRLRLDRFAGGSHLRCTALIAATLVTVASNAFTAAANVSEPGIHTPWKKTCFSSQKTDFRQICSTRAEAWKRDDDAPMAAVEIIEREGEEKKILRVIVPLGVQLSYGTRLTVYGNDPLRNPYATCMAAGCMSEYEATSALLGSMRAGQGLLIQAIDQSGKPLSVTLSLADFSAAYDGPLTEPVVDAAEEQRREMERRRPWLDDTLRPELRPRIR
jgi:invasion protein IalB